MYTSRSFRFLVLLLAMAVISAACGGTDSGGATTGDGSESSADDEAGADTGDTAGGGDETLTVWTYYVSGGQVDALEAQNELFAETHPDVTVEHVQLPFDQLAPRLLAGVATGDGPDIVFDNVVVDFPALAASGALLDLTEFWDGYADAGQFPDASVWSNGEGIYNLMSYTNLLALYYNADALGELGISPPETIEDLESAMATVADDGTYTPLAMSGVASPEGAWMFMPILLGQGINYCNLEGAAVEEAFGTLAEWQQSGYIPADTATWDQADAWQAFASGNYAFGINGNWNLGDIDSLPFEVGTVRYPAGSEGSAVFPGGEGIGIGAFTDNADLAWEYLETAWLSADAGLINFENSGQIPTRGDLADAPEVQENELVQPFVDAAGEVAAWPQSENTAAMQNAVGQAVSDAISGGAEPGAAATSAVEAVAEEIEEGGGAC